METEKILIKQNIVDIAENQLEEKIAFIRDSILEAQQIANDYGQPKDRYDGFRNQQIRKKGQLSQQLQNFMEDLMNLKKINLSKVHKKVVQGSVVITNQQKVFVSIGLGKIETKDGDFYLISPSVPFYRAIAGKKLGDSLVFNSKTLVIEDLF